MLIAAVFLSFIILLLLPFMPGIFELIRKKDAEPLFISMDYLRNPRYFGKSFKRLLHRATAGFTLSPGMRDVQLSKNEKVELTHSIKIPADKEINHIIYTIGNLISGNQVQFKKEVYVTGDASIGPNNTLQALAGDGNISIEEGVKFQRWLDGEGNIEVGRNCSLGISVSSGGRLRLAEDCIFRRLNGMPIITGNQIAATADIPGRSSLSGELLTPSTAFIRKKDTFIPHGTVINDNVVFRQDVKIGSDSILKGTIKSYGKIILEDNVTIDGNIFADGDIFIGRKAKIGGHIFSQASICISEQTIISSPEKIKSVIGKKSVKIEKDVVIYGYVTTEGDGIVI
jgi:predicted acyltransferase (DUF342 family)